MFHLIHNERAYIFQSCSLSKAIPQICSASSTTTKGKKIFFHHKVWQKMGNYQFYFTCSKHNICSLSLALSETKKATHFSIIVMAFVIDSFHFQKLTKFKRNESSYLLPRMPGCRPHPHAFLTGGCHRSNVIAYVLSFL